VPTAMIERFESALARGSRLTRLIHAARELLGARRAAGSPEEALELWRAFTAGDYTLLEHFESDGRQVILAARVRAPWGPLSARELAVVAGVAEGLGNKAIGAKLGISSATVAVHLARARRKIGLPDRRAILRWYADRSPVSGRA
jgi:DNA-binding CsgD family transcriptional regulator